LLGTKGFLYEPPPAKATPDRVGIYDSGYDPEILAMATRWAVSTNVSCPL
jgi:hypothetical protein